MYVRVKVAICSPIGKLVAKVIVYTTGKLAKFYSN